MRKETFIVFLPPKKSFVPHDITEQGRTVPDGSNPKLELLMDRYRPVP